MKRKCVICLREYETYNKLKHGGAGRGSDCIKKRTFGCPTCSKKCSSAFNSVRKYLAQKGYRKVK